MVIINSPSLHFKEGQVTCHSHPSETISYHITLGVSDVTELNTNNRVPKLYLILFSAII